MTPDTTQWLTAAAALAAVLGLVLLGGRLLRASGIAPAARAGTRLGVQETLALDPRRRLVLLRCDGREVLLLTGGSQDQVVGWLPERAP
jgi:flagellar protein FliO/FliZ